MFPSHARPVEQVELVEHANVSKPCTPRGTGGKCKSPPAIYTPWNRWNMLTSTIHTHPVEQVEQVELVEHANRSQPYTPRGTGGTYKSLLAI